MLKCQLLLLTVEMGPAEMCIYLLKYNPQWRSIPGNRGRVLYSSPHPPSFFFRGVGGWCLGVRGGGNYYPHYETMFYTPLLFQGLAAYLELKTHCVVLLNDLFYTVAVSSIGCLDRTENPLLYCSIICVRFRPVCALHQPPL